jgi:hypothetical protein
MSEPRPSTGPLRRLASVPSRWLAALAIAAVLGGILLATLASGGVSQPPGGSGDVAASQTPSFTTGGTASGSSIAPSEGSVAPPSGPGSIEPALSPSSAVKSPAPNPTAKPPGLPLRGNAADVGWDVRLAPGPGGGLYVGIPSRGRFVVALLDTDGDLVAGWPRTIPASSCWRLASGPDGSVRLMCDAPADGDGIQAPVTRVYGVRADGRPLPGWPVDVEGAFNGRMDGNDLDLLATPYEGDTPETTDQSIYLVRVAPDGTSRRGTSVTFTCCDTVYALGPAGTAIGLTRRDPDTMPRTDVVVFDIHGTRTGSPTVVDGTTSMPGIDAAGRIYLVVNGATGMHRIVLDGRGTLDGTPTTWPIVATSDVPGDGTPGIPIVAADGMNWIVDERDGTAILMVDRANVAPDDWPYRSSVRLAHLGFCAPGQPDCAEERVEPVAGADDTLFVPQAAPTSTTGARIVALDLSGHVRAGWPVTLRRPGSGFWSLVSRSTDGIWALAVEPEAPETYSATILSISQAGTVIWATTIVEP